MLFGGAGTFRQGEYIVLPDEPENSRQYRDVFHDHESLPRAWRHSLAHDMRKRPNAEIAELLA